MRAQCAVFWGQKLFKDDIYSAHTLTQNPHIKPVSPRCAVALLQLGPMIIWHSVTTALTVDTLSSNRSKQSCQRPGQLPLKPLAVCCRKPRGPVSWRWPHWGSPLLSQTEDALATLYSCLILKLTPRASTWTITSHFTGGETEA